MSEGSLSPYYVQLFYHSLFAPHVATLPLRNWNSGTPGTPGEFQKWDDTFVAAADALEDWADLIAPFFTPNTVIDYALIFSMPTPTSESAVVAGHTINTPGTAIIDDDATKALQATWTFKCDDNSILKLDMMDSSNGGSNDRVTFGGLAGASLALANFVVSDDSWLMSRKNGRPSIFLQISYTLNEKLRRQYHMT